MHLAVFCDHTDLLCRSLRSLHCNFLFTQIFFVDHTDHCFCSATVGWTRNFFADHEDLCLCWSQRSLFLFHSCRLDSKLLTPWNILPVGNTLYRRNDNEQAVTLITFIVVDTDTMYNWYRCTWASHELYSCSCSCSDDQVSDTLDCSAVPYIGCTWRLLLRAQGAQGAHYPSGCDLVYYDILYLRLKEQWFVKMILLGYYYKG